jgi:flagellar basal-body rod protein FlgG
MNDAFEISSIGLAAQQRALDILAGNIANINTPAFKRSDVRFSELLTRQSDPANPSAGLSEPGATSGVMARTITAFDETGEIQRTGKAMDLAISGSGFIELMGPRGQTMLWRGGALSIQADGLLSTQDGIPLRSMIAVPSDASDLRIDVNGAVTALTPDSGERTHLGDITLVRVSDFSSIEALDGGLYTVRDNTRLMQVSAGEDGSGVFMQGAIERSNVEINDEMVRLMIVQRSYAANAQVVQAADQLASITNTLRR